MRIIRKISGFVFGLTLVVTLVHFMMASANAENAMLTPLAVNYAVTAGYKGTLAGMAVSKAAMNIFIFPYQTTPLVLLWGTGYLNMRKCIVGFGSVSAFNFLWNVVMTPYWDWIMGVVK